MKVQRLNQMPHSLRIHKLKLLREVKRKEAKEQAKLFLISLGLIIGGIILCNVLEIQ